MDSPPSSPLQSPSTSTRSKTRGEHRRSHKDNKDKASLASTSKELVRLLVHEEQESQELRNTLHDLTERLKDETQRADNAEQKARDLAVRFKEAHDGRISAKQEAARVSEELRLYKLQLENAQREIVRAQELLDAVEAQRNEAEEAAARARSTARKLKEEKVVQLARDQGRIEGIKEGLERGKGLGYEEGRAEGYARGRTAAAKEFVQRGYVQKNGYMSPGTDDAGVRSVPSAPPTPPSDSPPARGQQPLPQSEPIQIQPPLSTTPPGPPPSVFNLPSSPQHVPVDYPPEGFIPVIDPDQRIRLPPPNELAPAPYLPGNSPTPAQAQPIPDPARESPALMIPPPIDRTDNYSDTDSIITPTGVRHRRPLRRRKSDDSASTTFSQFDLIGPPSANSARGNYGSTRPNVLSAIVEERSPSVAPSSYALSQTASPVLPIPPPMTMPTPQASVPISQDYERMQTPQHDYYTRPGSRSSPGSTPVNSPPRVQERPSPKGSVMSATSYHITVEPPSRPESSRSGIAYTQDGLLTANAAENPPPVASPQISISQPASAQPTTLQNGQLPPGFVVAGPPAQSPRVDPMQSPRHVPERPPTAPSAPPVDSSPIYQFYAPPSGGSSTPQQTPTPVVIPPPSSAHPRRYSRSALTKDTSSESDDENAAVSSQISSSSMDSFTTPPDRRKSLAPPPYAVAPAPPNVIYPVPVPRSVGSASTARAPLPGSPSTTTAAKVPLPPSSIGSPRSSYTRVSRSGGPLHPDLTGRSSQSTPPVVIPPGAGRG
ncbi:hypothetical protein BDY19DRAFT_993459 [Irpex rosettiformis]|uniref:Uncharacterized protein n=1 Tax=Irpex rosettiformis TaxID=378272 RepID=A0ACB8U4D6_9APHY|nr:hypothetical protein BDY19DRAFT_993459 [Irpex rosettiformis]